MLKNNALIFILLWPCLSSAQSLQSNIARSDNPGACTLQQNKELYKYYSKKINPAFELINGREYLPYYLQSPRKPILLSGKDYYSFLMTTKGMGYTNSLLEYDTFTDKLLVADSSRSFRNSPMRIELNKDNVDYFAFFSGGDTLLFRYLSKDMIPDFNLKEGYYEVVYDRKSKFIIRHLSSAFVNNGITEYQYFTISYINTGAGFERIIKIKQLMEIFGDNSHQARIYCRKNGIKMYSKDKKQIARVLKYYDTLQQT